MDMSDTELDMSETKHKDENLDKTESGVEDITDDEDDNDDDDEGDEDDDDNSEDDDDDEDDDGDDDEEDNEDDMLEVSDSDNADDVEKCPICLNRFKDQDVGTPESCDHMFCLECIQEWAKNVNTCPSDRQVFKLILCRHGVDDVIYKKISVEDKNVMAEEEEEEVEVATYCEVCRECNREDRLLLCDGCDLGYHLECLTPPLSTVPVEEWFCPACAKREDITPEIEEETAQGGRHRLRRQIPRTLVMERVRSAIEEIRVRRTRNLTRLLASDEDEPMEVEETSAASAATPSTSSPVKRSPRKRKTPLKRKTKRKYKKRKTKRKSTTAKKTPTKKTTRRRKTRKRKGKKVKRLARTARPSPATSVKTRIAGALGISNPPPGRTIPVQKSKQEVSIDSKRSEIGGTSFSIFGDREQLNYFEDEQTEAATSSVGPRKYSRLAMSSYGPIGRVPKVPAAKQKKKLITPEVSDSGSVLDILGTIMQDQTKLAMSSKNVTIQRDGSLTARPSSPKQPKKSDKSAPSLFKSSFQALEKKQENTSSVLSSLASEKDKSCSPAEDLEEEYDPAHPTDDIEDEVDKPEDVYDPAHPTDDVSDVSSEEENTAVDNAETDKLFKDFDSSSCAAIQTKDNNTVNNEHSGNSDAVIVEKSNASVENLDNISISITNEKCKTKKQTESAIFTEKTLEKDQNKSETTIVSPLATSTDQAAQLKSPTKLLSPDSNRETALKTSPSVKITETKKSPSGVKPFEISRKTLFEKRRLYGGEIDFSEDVDFSEGAFPETFELSMKRIEEVFKDTKSANDAKEAEKDKTLPTAEIDLSIVKVEPVEDKSLSKSVGNIDKEKIVVTNITVKEEKQKGKTVKDSGDKSKLPAKFKPIDSSKDDTDNSGTTKLSVSDRFKMIDKTRKTPETTNFDDEDPIHEMRKLDKELDLEFGNAEFAKKKERGKELKKNKRKVSLDDGEADSLRYRRESRENRDKKKADGGEYKYAYEEKEEGEVDEEYKMKDKKKKDKKKKKSDKHFDNDEKDESEIDRRIVIQVTQNTEDRTVWEEAERQRRKRDREERRKDKYRDLDSKKDRKSKRMRSRSRSHDRRRSRSKDRKRSRSRDRDRGRKKRRDRTKSRSRSREWSYERSRKKKKRDRKHSRDRERDVSRDWSRERSHEREWSWEKEWSTERGRERNRSRDKSRERIRGRKRSRDQSDDKVDMFGRSRSPFTRKGFVKTKQVTSHRPKVKPFRSDEVIEILDSSPPKKQKYDEVSSSESEKMSPERMNEDVQKISTIEVKSSGARESNTIEHDEKEDEFDDEPEETEQFQYTDREEFTGQNRGKQMRQNLITLGVGNSDYDPANPTDTASPSAPPLPDPLQAPTPPLPPTGDFAQFPPPPPGPPPQGPPPGSVVIQDHTSLHVPPGGPPPGQGILGEAPLLLQGPPPIETGPPPGIIQQRPAISLPVNINVLPPGFHRGLPPTISPQRQLLVSPLRSAPPRVRLPGGNVTRFGWQVTTSSDVLPSQFGTLIPSPARLPGHPIVNGPFDGRPTHSEASHNLPPCRPQFPSHSMAPGEPQPLISIKTDTPPPGMVPIQVDKGPRSHLRPSGPGDPQQLIHIGPDPRAPPPRLPIPLLPPSSDLPPISAMVSIPPPNSSLLSRPPPNISNSVSQSFNRPGTPPDSVSTILGLARMGAGAVSGSSSMIPGLSSVNAVNGNHNKKMVNSNGEIGKVAGTLNQLEKIGELLKQNSNKTNSGRGFGGAKDIFKVPVVPAGKSGGKADVETTEVIDMDMGSPIIEEGNIELPVSPQFDNLIDNPEDLLEEDFNKKMQKLIEKEMKKDGNTNKEKPKEKEKVKEKASTPTKNKAISEIKEAESKNDSPRKSKEEKQKRSKENKPEKSGHRSRRHHHHKKHQDGDKDLKQKALKDAHIDIDSQEVPSSAVDLTNKEKYLQKLHLQERVVEEVKMAIKPFYASKKINKDQYKEILRKAVPKICHSKSGNINPMKIKSLVEAYVEKFTKRSKESPHMEEDSPALKANGERSKTKTAVR